MATQDFFTAVPADDFNAFDDFLNDQILDTNTTSANGLYNWTEFGGAMSNTMNPMMGKTTIDPLTIDNSSISNLLFQPSYTLGNPSIGNPSIDTSMGMDTMDFAPNSAVTSKCAFPPLAALGKRGIF